MKKYLHVLYCFALKTETLAVYTIYNIYSV